MNKLLMTVAITVLGTTLAYAQISTGGGVSAGGGVSVGGNGANAGANANGQAGSGNANGSGNSDGSSGTNGNANGTNANGNDTNGANADGTNTNAAKESENNCRGMMGKAHAGSGDWTDAEAKPYLDKMSSANMSTKTKGKLSADEFMTACQNGAFAGMGQ